MNKSEYRKLVDEASKKKLRVTKQIEKEIRETYRNVAKNLEGKLVKISSNTLSEKWLFDYKKQLDREIDKITKGLYKSVKTKMIEIIEATNDPQLSLFQDINSKYRLGLENTFNSMFSRVNDDVLKEMLNGKIYKDNLGLSERLWRNSTYTKKDIQSIIMEGLVEKKSAKDLSKDLLSYLRPDASKTGKQAYYNATRLARTSINHSYQMATKRSAKNNPFIEGIKWHSAMQHGRTCQLCMDRDGEVFSVKDLPLDHP